MDGEAGNVAGDCVKGCCCCCCVVAQDEKEVKGREEEARRNRKVEEGLEGYGRVEGMVFGVATEMSCVWVVARKNRVKLSQALRDWK